VTKSKGMTSFDGRNVHIVQAELGCLIKPIQQTIIANIVSKAKDAIASAFRVSTPAMALA